MRSSTWASTRGRSITRASSSSRPKAGRASISGCAESPRSCSSSSSRCRPHNAPIYPLKPLSLPLTPNPHPNSQDRSRRGSKGSSRESSRHSKHGASDRGEGSGNTAYLDSSPSGSEAHEGAKSATAASPRTAATPAAAERQQSAGSGLAAAMEEISQEASRTPRVRTGQGQGGSWGSVWGLGFGVQTRVGVLHQTTLNPTLPPAPGPALTLAPTLTLSLSLSRCAKSPRNSWNGWRLRWGGVGRRAWRRPLASRRFQGRPRSVQPRKGRSMDPA